MRFTHPLRVATLTSRSLFMAILGHPLVSVKFHKQTRRTNILTSEHTHTHISPILYYIYILALVCGVNNKHTSTNTDTGIINSFTHSVCHQSMPSQPSAKYPLWVRPGPLMEPAVSTSVTHYSAKFRVHPDLTH